VNANVSRANAVLVLVAVFIFIVLATVPRLPYEWDAAGWWIPRAEIERGETGRLLHLMRTPGDWGLLLPDSGTHVFPIAYPTIVGGLAKLLPAGTSAMRASAVWLAILVAVLLIHVGRRLPQDADVKSAIPLALVLLSPFALVHMRSGYADLPVGLLSAVLVLAMSAAFEQSTMMRLGWMTLVSTLLVQTKQDGMILCVAVALTSALLATRRDQKFWRVVGLEAIVIVINLAGWAMLLQRLYGPDMPTRLRRIVGFDISAAPTFVYEIVRHALDVDSWGILWPALIALAIWRRDARWPAFIVIALGGYGLAHMLGPPYMLQDLREGYVMNRLLLQIAVASIPFTLDANSLAAESQPVRMQTARKLASRVAKLRSGGTLRSAASPALVRCVLSFRLEAGRY